MMRRGVLTILVPLLALVVWVVATGVVVHQHDQKEIGKIQQQSLSERDKLLGRITELEADLANERRVNDDIELKRIELEHRLAEAAERDRARQVRASRSRR